MQQGRIIHEGIAHEVRMGRNPREYNDPTETDGDNERWDRFAEKVLSNPR